MWRRAHRGFEFWFFSFQESRRFREVGSCDAGLMQGFSSASLVWGISDGPVLNGGWLRKDVRCLSKFRNFGEVMSSFAQPNFFVRWSQFHSLASKDLCSTTFLILQRQEVRGTLVPQSDSHFDSLSLAETVFYVNF